MGLKWTGTRTAFSDLVLCVQNFVQQVQKFAIGYQVTGSPKSPWQRLLFVYNFHALATASTKTVGSSAWPQPFPNSVLGKQESLDWWDMIAEGDWTPFVSITRITVCIYPLHVGSSPPGLLRWWRCLLHGALRQNNEFSNFFPSKALWRPWPRYIAAAVLTPMRSTRYQITSEMISQDTFAPGHCTIPR